MRAHCVISLVPRHWSLQETLSGCETKAMVRGLHMGVGRYKTLVRQMNK